MATSDAQEFEIKENVVYVKGFPADYPQNKFKQLFSNYGNIVQLNYRINHDKGPVAFVTYDTVQGADNAIDCLNGRCIFHRDFPLNITKAKRKLNTNKSSENDSSFANNSIAKPNSRYFDGEVCSNKLLVRGLPNKFNISKLIEIFESYGKVKDVFTSIDRNDANHGFASVNFELCSNAFKARQELNTTVIEGYQLNISFSKPLHKRTDCIDRSASTTRNQLLDFNTFNNSLLTQYSGNGAKDPITQSLAPTHRLIDCKFRVSVKNLSTFKPRSEPLKPIYISCTTFQDLTKSEIKYIFKYLPLKQLFGVRRVSSQWKNIIDEIMKCEKTVSFGTSDQKYGFECTDICHKSCDYNDLSDAIVTYNRKYILRNIEELTPIVRLMEGIECLHFANCFIDTIALKWIITQCPQLKCLRFDNIEGIGKLDWPKLGKPLSTKLNHFSFAGNKLNNWNSLSVMVSSFTQLQELSISNNSQNMRNVFQNLCSNVNKLTLIGCTELDSNSILGLRRRNGPNIREIEIDFAHNNDWIYVIENIYSVCNDLSHFKAFNMSEGEVKEFVHDFDLNSLSIIFYDFVNFNNIIVIEANSRGLQNFQITGKILPAAVEDFSFHFPDCVALKLKDCFFYCECDFDRKELLSERYYSCRQCLERIKNSLFIKSDLQYINLNGEEYDKENGGPVVRY